MELRHRQVRVARRLIGPCERFEFQDVETGRRIPLRPDTPAEWDVPFARRHELILAVAKAAGWQIERIAFDWRTGELVAAITLLSSGEDGARVTLESRAGSALRLAAATTCDVVVAPAALDELSARARPVSIAEAGGLADEILRAFRDAA